MRLTFEDFVIDFDQRRLFAGDHEIHVTPKGFELLKLLIENRPKAMAKDDIFARLWPDTFVSENNLATLVAELRSALGDSASDPRLIRTAYGFGYAFIAETGHPVPPVPAAAAQTSGWFLVHQHEGIPLHEGHNILGRPGPGVVGLDAPTVSRHHARLTINGNRAVIEDLGSKNGTWVGQAPVAGPTPIEDGDEIRLGSLSVMVRLLLQPASTETMERTP